MGIKTRKKKKSKKRKKRKKKRAHGPSEEVLSFPEIEIKRLESKPLYRQWNDLFTPGQKSFWERWLVGTPPSDQTRKYYSGVDATDTAPSMNELKERFRVSQLRFSDLQQGQGVEPSDNAKLPPIIPDKNEKGSDSRPENRIEDLSVTIVRDIVMCEECEIASATQICHQCEQVYCDACLLNIHHYDKHLLNHFWEPYKRGKKGRNSNTVSNRLR